MQTFNFEDKPTSQRGMVEVKEFTYGEAFLKK